nr:maintenance of ploidy protein mob2 [Quercus suber]
MALPPSSMENAAKYDLEIFVFDMDGDEIRNVPDRFERRRADLEDYSRAFGRGSNQTRSPNAPPSRGNTSSPSAYSPSSLVPPSLLPAPASPSLTASVTAGDQAYQDNSMRIPLFFKDQQSGFIVKGNFMTLAAKPALVSEAEWIAHQIAEQYRLLSGMLKCVEGENRSTGRGVCNETNSVTYTWIDTNRNPINLPAPIYIKHIQTWVSGKVQDPGTFPSESFISAPPIPTTTQVQGDTNYWFGKSDGFPQRFETEVRNMYKQMFRCYAHLYWAHWMDFWHLNCYRDLNTCFVHFVNVGRIFSLFSEKDIEPMKPLIDLWVQQGVLPELTSAEPRDPKMPENTPVS